MMPKVLIPFGFGLNCEDETKYAFELSGARADKVHLRRLLENPQILRGYHLLALVGGFSYGDHISAGVVLGNLYRLRLSRVIEEFISEGKLIFGECNGFQVMLKSGILPRIDGSNQKQQLTLMSNDSGIFEDRWVSLRVNPRSRCVFTSGIRRMFLPVRHGEGKFYTSDTSILRKLEMNGQIVMQYVDEDGKPTMKYPLNPNGSVSSIAGICDPTGRVFGLMPHPTAYISVYNHPRHYRMKVQGESEPTTGIEIFKNAVTYMNENLK
ncbi:MAG: phosphoribosylformylglycinamidine synthase subunit PurQ [Nitrososphaeria archaeon]